MAEKTFCDVCGEEVENPRYTLSLFDSRKDDNLLHKDLCNVCMKHAKGMIENL